MNIKELKGEKLNEFMRISLGAFKEVMIEWDISKRTIQGKLLGMTVPTDWKDMTKASLTRVSYILGIYSSMRKLAWRDAYTKNWLDRSWWDKDISPLQFILKSPGRNLKIVRDHLAAAEEESYGGDW